MFTEREKTGNWKEREVDKGGSIFSGFRREVDENCALLGHHAASSANSLPTFRDILSLESFFYSWPLKLVPIGCPETSERNYRYSLCNDPEERSSQWGVR
jgi:hypothetical protein